MRRYLRRRRRIVCRRREFVFVKLDQQKGRDMQRMYNLEKWMRLTESSRLEFSNPKPRTVRFEVNAPGERALYVADDLTGECRFLALTMGCDVIEFSANGAFSLLADDPAGGQDVETWVFTADGADVSIVLEAPESFTKIVERRRRNPELEAVMAVMQRNLERRFAQQSVELAERLERSAAARAAERAAASVPSGPAPSPGQTGDGGPPRPQATAAASGDQGGEQHGTDGGADRADLRGSPASPG